MAAPAAEVHLVFCPGRNIRKAEPRKAANPGGKGGGRRAAGGGPEMIVPGSLSEARHVDVHDFFLDVHQPR